MEDVEKTVQELVDKIRKTEEDSRSGIAEGRRLSWLLVGEVYAGGCEIGTGPKREKLNQLVDAHPDMKDHPGWIPSQKTVFECLLVAALGYEKTLSKRHYYSNACKNAQKDKVESTAEAFADWVGAAGGLMAVAKGEAGDGEKASDLIKRFIAKRENVAAPKKSDGEVVKTDFTPASDGGNLGVFLVEHLAEGGSRIIGITTRTSTLATVIKDVDDELSAPKLLAIEKLAIWDLNRVTEKLEGAWRGDPEPSDIKLFREAVRDLQDRPTLSEKYFDGVPKAESEGDKELKVQNLKAPILDPARYISNAKVGVLTPFDVSKIVFGKNEQKRKKRETVEALPGYKAWRESPPRRRPSKTD